MEETYHADVTVKYKDSNSVARISDMKSKKKGMTLTQFFGGMTLLGYHVLSNKKAQEWWDKGIIHKNITNLRKMNIESGNKNFLSRTGALRAYKVIVWKLTPEQRKKPVHTYDNFTRDEIGLDD